MWLVRWIKPLGFVLLVLLAGLRLDAQIDRITGKNFATRSEVLARHGMVCTSVPAATQVGVDILKRGGSAVDAAIRCKRNARFDGAGLQRGWRRSLRNRL